MKSVDPHGECLKLTDRGVRLDAIDERHDEYARDLLLALEAGVRPSSITAGGTRSILQRLSGNAEINHPKHDSLAPHSSRRGMSEVLARAFGYTIAVRCLNNSEEMVRKRYSHIEAGELGNVVTEALEEVDGYSLRLIRLLDLQPTNLNIEEALSPVQSPSFRRSSHPCRPPDIVKY